MKTALLGGFFVFNFYLYKDIVLCIKIHTLNTIQNDIKEYQKWQSVGKQ